MAGMAGGEEEEMESLLQWAATIGISDSPTASSSASSCLGHSLSISTFPNNGGRGMAAARELRRGEPVLRVPRAAILTTDSVVAADERIASCVRKHSHLSSTKILTVCLLAEVGKGRSSGWYPYLVHLPRSYNTLANFTQSEIQALQVEDAIWVSEKAVQKSKSDWKMAIVLMQEMELKPQLLTFKAWLWASATLSSRTLHVPWDDAGCLCPIGDLFNYAAPEGETYSEDLESPAESLQSNLFTSVKYNGSIEQFDSEQPETYSLRLTDGGYEESTDSYCFYARERYRKGEQVLLSYGTYSNLELLEHYGFLLDVNPNDKAFLQLNTDIQTSSCWPKDSLYIQPDGCPSFSLLCSLRLWATPLNLRRAVGHRAYSGSLLSAKNELFVMKWLISHCQDSLRKLPTTIEDDELLLDVIDKLLDHPSHKTCCELLSPEGELSGFLKKNGLQKNETGGCVLPTKANRSLERWRLAVRWRISHKKTLRNCISYCKKQADKVSS
ncbi:protein SET DOMAIN GROUP 40 [Iris pallida]|uniref:Protein SET DOMAIN GROUP 40 n=1 Tax=Iris pallida TaxID=29817 RepID=A0AAX6DK68_IRIPA|nr:protein SET DOMAIN GROUP 40 [Iris pallida]